VHILVFIIRIYHDARSCECQIHQKNTIMLSAKNNYFKRQTQLC